MQGEKPKDPMVTFRSTVRGKNSKGGDRTQLYLNLEMANLLISEITKGLSDPLQLGVKLDIHTSKKIAQGTNREFDSTICFVKPVQEASSGGRSFAPRANPQAVQAQTFSQVEQFKKTL